MQMIEGKKLGGRYEIVSRVGGGGMAIVYKARDVLLNRFVAIKVLNESLSNDTEFIRRFNREAQAAASLSHSNIVNVYDVGKDGYAHYIVMELVEGPTLKEYIQESGPLTEEKAALVSVQICEGLAHAHDNQIVHRDIKPHNILLGNKGQVKVTDFGIARAASSSTITRKGSVMGSVHYFSPEQARGGSIGEKSDIYSLGVVLYEMVTGVLPFDGDSAVSIALKHLQEPLEDPRKYNPSLTEGFVNIVLKALAKDPIERFASSREMIQEIKRVVEMDYPLELSWLKKLKKKPKNLFDENLFFEGDTVNHENSMQTERIEKNELLSENTKRNLNQIKKLPFDRDNSLFQKTAVWFDQVQQNLPLWQKIIFGLFTVTLIIGISLGGLNLFLGLWTGDKATFFAEDSVQIPKFKNELEAKQWLSKRGFPAPEVKYKLKKGIGNGQVFDQDPSPGISVVPRKTKVLLVVGSLKDPVTVEDYLGQWESRAKSDLYKIEYYYCPGPNGTEDYHVFAQQPKSGEKIEKGSIVKVWIHAPEAVCKVPPPGA